LSTITDAHPVILPPDTLQAVGFAPEEALSRPARSFWASACSAILLRPRKFLFIDICRLDAKTLVSAGNPWDIFIYLDRAMPELERSVQANSLTLGCTDRQPLPALRADPLDPTHEYRIERRARPASPRSGRSSAYAKACRRRVPDMGPFHG
jgi:type VI secretion system protein ImpG